LTPAAEGRVAIALLLMPFVSAALGFLLFPILLLTIEGTPADMIDGAVAFGLGIGIASVLVIVFGALPLLVWLLKRGPVTRRHALLAGAVLGNLPWVLIAMRLLSMGLGWEVLTGGHQWLLGSWRALLFGSTIGMASAGVFWLLAGRQLQSGQKTA
jgi:hypothetical protein